MKTTELRELTDEELRQRLAEARNELFDLRIQKSTEQLERPVRIREARRAIATMLTLARQRGIV